MVKEMFLSFKDNLIQKTKNPFLGTYVIVWIIRNWKLVYSLLNFDSDTKRETKVTFIESYFVEKPFITNILWNILISILVLIITYTLLNLSRLVVNFYDKIISPWVYKITDKSSIVLKTDYKILEIKNEVLEKKIDDLKKERNQLQGEVDKLEKNKKENKFSQQISDTKNEINIDKLYQKIKENKGLNSLLEIDIAEKKRSSLKESPKFDILLRLDLISIESYDVDDLVYYNLTKDGKSILNYYNSQRE